MSGDPLGLYDYRPGDGNNVLLQKILRAASALPGSMGIPEAPIDGQPYARMNAGWVVAAGGVSVIAGVVDVHGDLPVTVGSPVLNSAYLVRESSGAWLPFYDTRKAGGIWIRQFNNGNLDDWVYSGELQATQNASNFTVYDPTDPTKEIGFSAAGITAGARRILTPLDKNYTLEETGHAAKHVTGGTDVIANAVAAGNAGLMSGADKTKLDGIEAGADVTDAANVAAAIHGVAGKTTPADTDELGLLDSAAAFALKALTWANVKATLKIYFDTVYSTFDGAYSSLSGIPSTFAPSAHKTSHENGGTDEISVAGLSGVLADPQPPIIGATGTTAVAGNDARLTDERVPTAAGLTTKFGTNKASIADGDKMAALDSAAADAPVYVLWSLVKSTLKTYLDTLYGNKVRVIGFTVSGSGAATGKVKGFVCVPYGAVMTGWSITVDAGTATVNVWKIAAGTAKPTIANVIAAYAPAIASGTHLRTTGLTTATVTAGDIFAFEITAISGVTDMTFNQELTQT